MLSYISLFSCGGVGCYGFKQQGFECVATNEIELKRLNIQKANKKCKYETGYINGDITLDETKNKIFKEIEYWKEHEGLKEVDVLLATPPCQGMSSSNFFKKDETDRNSLVVEAIKMVEAIKPKFFIFENVTAFPRTSCLDTDGNFKLINVAIHEHLNSQYDIVFEQINFLNYGSNSSRNRCLTLGVRKDLLDLNCLFQEINLLPKKQEPKNIRQCIGHLKSLGRNEWDNTDLYHFASRVSDDHYYWIEKVKEGQSAFNQDDETRRPPTTSSVEWANKRFVRAYWNKPCNTILVQNKTLTSQGQIHPNDHRPFSIRELMIFQTIPEDFIWIDGEINKDKILKNENLIRACIGESVPTAIFNQIAQNIKSRKAVWQNE